MNKSHKIIFKLLKIAALIYLGICAYMYFKQRDLMYHPGVRVNAPATYGLTDFTASELTTEDNVKISTWHHAASPGYPTVIFLHGNGGNLSHRVNFFEMLSKAGFGVIGMDYRGYGNSEGSPSEEGFYNDGRATIEFAIKQLSIPENNLIIFGESIGSAVAVQMATEYKIGGLLLQSPFASMTETAAYHYPWLPVKFLILDHFDSQSKIGQIKTPLLLMHGEKDKVVPIEFGKKLFSLAPEPKKSIYYKQTAHSDFQLDEVIKSLIEFSKANNLIR